MYTYMYLYLHVPMYMHLCICLQSFIHLSVEAFNACVYVGAHVHMDVCMHMSVRTDSPAGSQ